MRRLKIEFIPPFFTLIFVGLIYYLLLSNQIYWAMFNSVIAGLIYNIQLNYVLILLVLLGCFGGYCIGLLLMGLFRSHIIHRPIINLLPMVFTATMIFFLLVAININVRINLDYFFFMLGEERGFQVYMAITIGVFALSLFIFGNVKPLLKITPESERLDPSIKLHPKFIATTTSISTLMALAILLALAFYYPLIEIYWGNIEGIYNRYVIWSDWWMILWMVTLSFTLIWQYYPINGHKKRLSGEELYRIKKYRTVLVISFLAQCGMIGLTIIMFEDSISPTLSGLSAFLVMLQIPLAIISVFPFFRYLYVTHLQPKLDQRPHARVWKVSLLISIIFIPYWITFYHPLVFGPPRIDLPSLTNIKLLNNIPVPFQNMTVFSSFEWQSPISHQYLNLSGEWKYHNEDGSTLYSLSPRSTNFMPKITQGQHLPAYSDTDWETIQIPSSVVWYEETNSEKYWGVTWFRKQFTIPDSFADQTIMIKFLGVNYIADVWLDGHYLGYHEGGFTPFNFDISDLATPGSHVLAVRVDNPEWDKMFSAKIVPDGADFFNYGGIEREVYIETAPRIAVQRVDVQQVNYTTTNNLNGSVKVNVNVVLKSQLPSSATNKDANLIIGVYPLAFPTQASMISRDTWSFALLNQGAITPYQKTIQLTSHADTNYMAVQIPLDLPMVQFWSTKRPNLYGVMVNLTHNGMTDQFWIQTGFRNISISGTNLTLNGADLKLAGVSVHEQYPYPVGRSLNDSLHFQDMICVKNTSSNWWRGSYPFHPISYIYSDRLGLACWEEAPVFWVNEVDLIEGFARQIYTPLWTEILFRDFNRPSVIFWGACNEPWAQGNLFEYLRQTKSFLDTYDPSRILSFACVSSQDWNPAFHEANLRALTPNTYGGTFDGVIGDFYGELSKELDRFSSKNPGKPLVSMEWGLWRGGQNDEEQRRCFEEGYRAFTEHSDVCQGFTWWLAFDYYGTNYYNSMGIYNHERTWHSQTFDAMVPAYSNFTRNNI